MSDDIKRYVVKLIKREIVGDDYYIFDFEVPSGLSFKEGQYGVFMHINNNINGRKVRAFSIASSKDENFFRIATKIVRNPSEFKVKMRELNIGDTMTFDGPMGSFTINDKYDSVFIAGGIGITPVRGILKQIEQMKLHKKAALIYSEPRSIYPFRNEFDEMDFLEKYYKNNIENTKEAIMNTLRKYQNKAFYYISGSPSFVSGVLDQLTSNGIDRFQIKFDRFNGY